VGPVDRLTLSSSERHELPREEQEFIDGCRAIVLGQDETALLHLRKVLHLADGAFLAGVVALKMNRLAEATEFLSSITERECALDRHLSRAGISVAVRLPVSDEVSAEVNPDLQGVLLALSLAYLKQKRWRDARGQLQRLRRIQPYDTAAKLAMAEWHLRARPGERQAFVEVIRLAEGIEGESAIEAALLLDKTKALRGLGRIAEALTTLVALQGRRKHYSEDFNEAVAQERKALLATEEPSG